MSYIQNNSIFWVEVDKVEPNPFQPRREFDEAKLNDLAGSIKMYGLLQPLVVTRREVEKEDGGLMTVYELISGERRLRASKIAGLAQVPVIIRSGEEDDKVKLELAIIENLQREDLNPVERAKAFQQLADQFGFKHQEIAKKVGKSREYVSNTIRILALPDTILDALASGNISEGHARPILMLKDKPQEQITLYKEVVFKKLNVREAEAIARRIAYDKVRKQTRAFDPDLVEMEDKLAETLGTRVLIEKKNVGGKITIDFFSDEDLTKLIGALEAQKVGMSSINDIADPNVKEPEENHPEEKDSLNNIVDMNDESVAVADHEEVSETKDEEDTLAERPNVSIPEYPEEEPSIKEEDKNESSVSDFSI